jgi:hypothetical protein
LIAYGFIAIMVASVICGIGINALAKIIMEHEEGDK